MDLSLKGDCQLTDDQVDYILKKYEENNPHQDTEEQMPDNSGDQSLGKNKLSSRLADLQAKFGSIIEKIVYPDSDDFEKY